jgi:hypothetical protein
MQFTHTSKKEYINASFIDKTLSKVAVEKYIEFWDGEDTNINFSGGWFNSKWGKIFSKTFMQVEGVSDFSNEWSDPITYAKFVIGPGSSGADTYSLFMSRASIQAATYNGATANGLVLNPKGGAIYLGGALYPLTALAGTLNLGSSTLRWNSVYAN